MPDCLFLTSISVFFTKLYVRCWKWIILTIDTTCIPSYFQHFIGSVVASTQEQNKEILANFFSLVVLSIFFYCFLLSCEQFSRKSFFSSRPGSHQAFLPFSNRVNLQNAVLTNKHFILLRENIYFNFLHVSFNQSL